MAMGTYLAPGSVKDLKSCYVGAGGVKTVGEIYVGAGGVKKVWPSYTDYGDTCDLLAKSYLNTYIKYSNGGSVAQGSASAHSGIYSSYATTGVNTSTYYIGDSSKVGATITSSYPNACHFFYTTALDTRGYSYICVRCLCNTSSSNSSTYRARPFVSYVSPSATVTSSWTNNLAQLSSDISIYGRSSASDISSYGFYVLFDISKMQQESAVICFGARLANNASESGSYGGLYINNCTLCKEKPSTSVSATVTWG